MAFESFTSQLLSRADEAHDPGSGDAFLRLVNASEAMLKLTGICMLSEAVYRHGAEPAKNIIADMLSGRSVGWARVFEISGRLPTEHLLVRRLTVPPDHAAELYEICTGIDALLKRELDVVYESIPKPKSLAWRHALRILPHVRNKVKGHGAPPARLYPPLNDLLRRIVRTAVADLLDPLPPVFAFVRPTREGHGLFLGLGSPVKEAELRLDVPTLQPGDLVMQGAGGQIPLVPLVTFEERGRTVLLFNDSVSESTGEIEYIDYLGGPTSRRPGHFVTRHGFAELKASETSATPVLQTGNGIVVPNNLPARRRAHVSRPEVEEKLRALLLDDRRRVLSLDGRGGIGKTYLAIEVCNRIAREPEAAKRFSLIVWVSGRDIDLTASGPTPVKQDVVTLEDVMHFVLRACGETADVDALKGKALSDRFVEACEVFKPLIVLDNFETYEHPEKLFAAIEDLLPLRSMVLITSRHREYQGDYRINVQPMTDREAKELILSEARHLFVQKAFETSDRVQRVYDAAGGHPYTMRLIVGQVGKGMSVHDACTMTAKDEKMLKALFERSLRLADPADVELALVLATARTACPLEALLLLPLPIEETKDGLGRLVNLSLLEKIEDPVFYDAQYACPRAAGEYIRGTDMFGSPKARERVDELAVRLREHTQTIRALAKKMGGGEKTKGQTAGAMMEVARRALGAKQPEVARRAVEVAVGYDGENASIVGEAAILLRKAGSKADDVDGMFGKALDLDPTNADAWLEWGRFKAETRAPHGQVMRCYERALEADPGSLAAVVGFAESVLEVIAQEKKLGAGAVRGNDRRTARTLLGKARSAIDALLGRRDGDAAAREKLLVAKGRIALEQEGASETVRQILRELEKIAPRSAQARALRDAMNRAEGEARVGGTS